MARGRVQGHPPRRTLCPYVMHIGPTLTSEFGFKVTVLVVAKAGSDTLSVRREGQGNHP
jgi:hypothetical protein